MVNNRLLVPLMFLKFWWVRLTIFTNILTDLTQKTSMLLYMYLRALNILLVRYCMSPMSLLKIPSPKWITTVIYCTSYFSPFVFSHSLFAYLSKVINKNMLGVKRTSKFKMKLKKKKCWNFISCLFC